MIPAFDIHGVLPPIRPGEAPHGPNRAPYLVDTTTFCTRFGSTTERRTILLGLLDMRAGLRAANLDRGFQWVDGSFTEDVETTRRRPPGDVDVVTFAALGDVAAQRKLAKDHANIVDPALCKQRFHVDHFLVATDVPIDERYIQRVSYWYSMWAHRRSDQRWKGFVTLPLQSDDDDARKWLSRQATASVGGAT